jgi:hypothetical protein
VSKFWRRYSVLFQGKKSLNSRAIERFFNAEKGKKNKTKWAIYLKTVT